MSKTDLSNYAAIITGSSRGIGFSIATMLAGYGAQVCAIGREFAKPMETWRELGLKTIYPICADLTNPLDAETKILGWLTTHGAKLDLLINNAAYYGRNARKPIIQTTLPEWDQIFAVNIRAAFIISKLVVPFLARQNGLIINISSQAVLQPAPGRVAYGASKSALDSFTIGLADELSPNGISTIGLHPGGPVKTPGIISRRSTDFDYTGYLVEDILNSPIFFLVTEKNARSKLSGRILSALEYNHNSGWDLR